MGTYFFGYNMLREPFTVSPELRRALAMAIDRDLLTDKVSRFGELPAYTLVPPGIGDYQSPQPEWSSWPQGQREEEARRLYALAGYTAERPLSVEIRYNTSENHKKMALAMAALWKQVLGVEARLVNEEWKVFLQNRQQKVLTEVFRAGWISDYADPYSFLEQFRTGHGQNDYGYSNRMFDSLLDQVAAERIPARRRRLMQEAERILLEDQPIIPVYTYVTKRLVDRHLAGWENNVMDHHYSKHMFLLRSAEPGATPSPAEGP
jgi:oligopeptide transport system substrate-binding protein